MLDGPTRLDKIAPMISGRTALCALALLSVVASGCDGCEKKDDAKPTASPDAAPSAFSINISPSAPSTVAPVPPGGFKSFFPKDGEGGFTRVFSSEKEGFAEAKLQKAGTEVAILSIADAQKLVYAKAKFEGATDKLEGFPVLAIGPNQSSVLVADRFQVKITSQTLDHEARKAILATFDLKGLAAR